MQEEIEVLGENLRGQVWIENQIHIRLWPDWESNSGRIGERHGNNCCPNPPTQRHMWMYRCNGSPFQKESLNMSPIFYKTIPKQWSVFPKFIKIAYTSRKIPKNGYFFAKMILKNGYGFLSDVGTYISRATWAQWFSI